MAPVTQLAAGDARNVTAFAMSRGAPHRASGMARVRCSIASLVMRSGSTAVPTSPAVASANRSVPAAGGRANAFSTPSVGTGPGATAFTRTLAEAHSSASVRVRASMPPFAAVVQRHRNVHDASAPRCAQVWQRGLGAEERAGQVDLDDAPPRVRAHRFGRNVEVAGGVVHEQVQPPVPRRDAGHDLAYTVGIAHVERC